ncbi:MAG: hypothetical protein E6J41_32395 [Chloroflexi bacterium]|nr:MAG: hypothetical protein E6J41_32395 [Chloroflexota bacterium]
MGIDTRALDAGRTYPFQVRLTLGTISPVAAPTNLREMEVGVRGAGQTLSRRAALVADALRHLAERGWRPQNHAPAGREVLAGHGFAAADGTVLPEAVAVVKDASPGEVARDLAGTDGDLAAELAEGLTVWIEDLDLPVVLTGESAELRYSPREYVETFSIRG